MPSLLDLLEESNPMTPEPDQPEQAEPPKPDQPDPEQRIIKRIMDSKVIGKVELIFNLDDPDSVMVDGVKYSDKKEIQNLLLKKKQMKMDAEALRCIYEIKKFFAGSILADDQVKEIDDKAYKPMGW